MTGVKTIEIRNFLLDVFITLIAFQIIDFSSIVSSTLHWAVYLLIPVQSFALFLLWGDESVSGQLKTTSQMSFAEKTKIRIELWARFFVMFSWIIGFIWAFIPIGFLEAETGGTWTWARRISFGIGILSGLLILVRLFANTSDVEKRKIADWRRKPVYEKTIAERIILPIYGFFIYGNIGNARLRSWLGFVVISAFLVYTETLFEILHMESTYSNLYLIPAIIFSYFPMRMIILIDPPFSLAETFSALAAFGIFAYLLFF